MVRMDKGKLEVKYDGGIKQPISRTLDYLPRKGTERRKLKDRIKNYFCSIMASKLSHSIKSYTEKH